MFLFGSLSILIFISSLSQGLHTIGTAGLYVVHAYIIETRTTKPVIVYRVTTLHSNLNFEKERLLYLLEPTNQVSCKQC